MRAAACASRPGFRLGSSRNAVWATVRVRPAAPPLVDITTWGREGGGGEVCGGSGGSTGRALGAVFENGAGHANQRQSARQSLLASRATCNHSTGPYREHHAIWVVQEGVQRLLALRRVGPRQRGVAHAVLRGWPCDKVAATTRLGAGSRGAAWRPAALGPADGQQQGLSSYEKCPPAPPAHLVQCVPHQLQQSAPAGEDHGFGARVSRPHRRQLGQQRRHLGTNAVQGVRKGWRVESTGARACTLRTPSPQPNQVLFRWQRYATPRLHTTHNFKAAQPQAAPWHQSRRWRRRPRCAPPHSGAPPPRSPRQTGPAPAALQAGGVQVQI